MSEFIFFLVKVSLCLITFYLPFIAILSKTTFFTINRIYLLIGILLSFVLPFISIESVEVTHTIAETFIEPIQFTEAALVINHSNQSKEGINYDSIFITVYALGFIICLARLFFSVRHISILRSKGKILFQDRYTIVQTTTPQAFTFFKTIFLPEGVGHHQIINHERTHIIQFHWVDLIIVEIASAILWFNPLMVFMRRAVKLQHEYLADRSTVSSDYELEEYLNCLVVQCRPIYKNSFISPFNLLFIKKRINMLTQKRTSVYKIWIYFIIVPIIFLMLTAFSNKKPYSIANNEGNDSTQQKDLVFIAPLEIDTIKISSGFGERINPIYKKKMMHTGVDVLSREGDRVIAPEGGVVVKSLFMKDRGNYIVIKHDEVFSTSYSHLQQRLVKEGDQVSKAQLIGLVGNTGYSTDSHLHYEVLKDGEPVDPVSYLPKK